MADTGLLGALGLRTRTIARGWAKTWIGIYASGTLSVVTWSSSETKKAFRKLELWASLQTSSDQYGYGFHLFQTLSANKEIWLKDRANA